MKDIEKDEIRSWLYEVLPLYRQADAVTYDITRVDADGLPADIGNLTVIISTLTPILAKIKKMPKPRYSKLQKLHKDFRLMLDAYIKSAKYRLKIEKKWNRLWFSTAVFWTDLAVNFKKSLSPKMNKMIRDFDEGGLP